MSTRFWQGLLAAAAGLTMLTGVACTTAAQPELDYLVGEIGEGYEYANWTPIDPRYDGVKLDLSVGLELKEAIGVKLSTSPYWRDPEASSPTRLYGVVAIHSSAPDVVSVFSASPTSFVLLAHAPGETTLDFTITGYPGTIQAPVKVTAAADFVDVDERQNVETRPDAGGDAADDDDAATNDDAATSDAGAGNDASTTDAGDAGDAETGESR